MFTAGKIAPNGNVQLSWPGKIGGNPPRRTALPTPRPFSTRFVFDHTTLTRLCHPLPLPRARECFEGREPAVETAGYYLSPFQGLDLTSRQLVKFVSQSPSFLNRFFTSLRWKSREQSFSSSPLLKCFATAGSDLSCSTKSASSRPACFTSHVFIAAS